MSEKRLAKFQNPLHVEIGGWVLLAQRSREFAAEHLARFVLRFGMIERTAAAVAIEKSVPVSLGSCGKPRETCGKLHIAVEKLKF